MNASPNILSLLGSSDIEKLQLNEGYKQLKELETRAVECQREYTKVSSQSVPEAYVAEAREKFSTLGEIIVHGHDVFDRALEEFRTLIHQYAVQSKRHGEPLTKTTLQKRKSIETVLDRVKDATDKASRRLRLAEGDYRHLLNVEKKWTKEKTRSDLAREMDMMNPRDATFDETEFKHLRNMIQNEAPKDATAKKDLHDLLLTERKYSTLHPKEEQEKEDAEKTPEIKRRPSLQDRKQKGAPARNPPHRGTLKRSPSQTSVSSEDLDGDKGERSPTGEGKKIPVSTEMWQEMQQREKLYLAKIEELTTRLSSFASKQLLDGNPNIADLSDPNRPTRLCEKFNCVYDNEWTEAFEELQSAGEQEEDIIKMLMEIIINAVRFCKDVKEQQLENLMAGMRYSMVHVNWTSKDEDMRVAEKSTAHDPKCFASVIRSAKEFQKASAKASIPSLCVMFKETYIKDACKLEYRKLEHLEHYVDQVVELVWLMVVQDPPLSVRWQREGEAMDKKMYKYYERKGDVVRLTVWPAVLLYDNGPLVSKGFIWPQAKKS